MPFYNPLPGRTGSSRFFVDDGVQNGTWRPEAWADGPVIRLDDGRDVPVTDADEKLGFVYRAPDSESEMTNIMVMLNADEPDPVGIPKKAELAASLMQSLMPVLTSIAAQQTDPDDLDYARQLFSTPACLLRWIQKHGSIDAARTAVLSEVFRIG